MLTGFLTSMVQTLKRLKDHEYIQRTQDVIRAILPQSSEIDYSHLTTRKTRLQLLRLSAAVCGIELCYAAETAFVSPMLLKLGVPVAFMTLAWCVSPLLGFFLVPIMGSLSDRCPLKLGRRRPFIIFFSVGIVVGLILVPNSEKFGLLAGDKKETFLYSQSPINDTGTLIKHINSTNDLVRLRNGTTVTLRSSFSPEWPSAVEIPHNHLVGILLTVFGVALLDFNCDACQSPCRTYLLDVSIPEDHPRGLTSFTVMAGLGGSFGYLMGGINWEATGLGTALGGHVRIVFTGVMLMYIFFVGLTLTSFKEMPLKEIGNSTERQQKKVKRVKRAKYRKFVNESSEDDAKSGEADFVYPQSVSYGTVDDIFNADLHKEPFEPVERTSVDNRYTSEPDFDTGQNGVASKHSPQDGRPNGTVLQNGVNEKRASVEKSDHFDLFHDASLIMYLRSIVSMPRSMLILCLTNLFCWMSLVCYSLYFTDFVGQSVYGGDPMAPIGSVKHNQYEAGVRLGSLGMALYSLSCAIYSLAVDRLVERFTAKPVYICGQLVYTAGMVILAVSRHPVAVILMSPSAGIMYATLFTIPYILVAHYHSSGKFSAVDEKNKGVRGLGTDVALVSSMVFLAQFLLSLCMGSLVHLAGSTVTVVVAAAVLSFCGAISATQVTYLDI